MLTYAEYQMLHFSYFTDCSHEFTCMACLCMQKHAGERVLVFLACVYFIASSLQSIMFGEKPACVCVYVCKCYVSFLLFVSSTTWQALFSLFLEHVTLYIYIYIYIYIYTYTYICLHARTHVRMYACTHVRTPTHARAHNNHTHARAHNKDKQAAHTQAQQLSYSDTCRLNTQIHTVHILTTHTCITITSTAVVYELSLGKEGGHAHTHIHTLTHNCMTQTAVVHQRSLKRTYLHTHN